MTNADLQYVDGRQVQFELYARTVFRLAHSLALVDDSEANKGHMLIDMLAESVTGIENIAVSMANGAVVFVKADLPRLGTVTVTL